LWEILKHPFLTYSIFRALSVRDVGELMQFANLSFYSIFHHVDLFSILLCEAFNGSFLTESSILFEDYFLSETCPLKAKDKTAKLSNMLDIAMERDLPDVYLQVLDRLIEMKRVFVHEFTETYNRLSEELESIPVRDYDEEVKEEVEEDSNLLPIMDEEEHEFEESVEHKMLEKFIFGRYKHFIINCPNIFFKGIMCIGEEKKRIETISKLIPKFANSNEREWSLEKFILALAFNHDKDLPYVLDRLCEYLSYFSFDFAKQILGSHDILKMGVLKSCHICKLVKHIVDREKTEANSGDMKRILSIGELQTIFDEMDHRQNYETLDVIRRTLLEYREKDML